MRAGPKIITNSAGRKKTIIGMLSFGGSAAAFFSASAMRTSRFSRYHAQRLTDRRALRSA